MSQTNEVNRRDAFLAELGLNLRSGVGVVLVRTLEPFRVHDGIMELAIQNNRNVSTWDMNTGVRHHKMSKLEDPGKVDPTMKPLLNILSAFGEEPTASGDLKEDSWLILMWPHFGIQQLPQAMYAIADLSRSLPEGKRRLIMVAPADFEVPLALREMLPVIDYGIPDRSELSVILDSIIGSVGEAKRPSFNAEDHAQIVSTAVGLTELEAEAAFSKALMTYTAELPNLPVEGILHIVARAKTEAVKRSDILELMEAGDPDDVGGLEVLKEWLHVTAECMTVEAEAAGVDRPKGCLFVGVPGTGKSATARATAAILRLPLIRVNISRVFSSLVGSSEQRMQNSLRLLAAMAPCVAFVDEVDKIFNVNSGGGDSGVGTRVLGSMLTFMQDNNSGIFWVLTANRTDGLPSELLRKGRLDEIFNVGVPNQEERRMVMAIHLRKRNCNIDDINDIDLALAASDQFVPAEIEAAVKEAVKHAYYGSAPVTGALIAEQFSSMKPLCVAYRDQFESMRTWAENNARSASRLPDNVNKVGRIARQATTGKPGVKAAPKRSRQIGG